MISRSTALGALLLLTVVAAAPTVTGESVSLDEEHLPITAAEQQVVSGSTSLEPGTELTVRLRSGESSAPFLRQQTAYVTRNGTFAAVFDMSAVAANTSYRLTVLRNGTELAQRSEAVVACERNCTDTVPPAPGPTVSERVRSVDRGETATIQVIHRGHETVRFSLADPESPYRIEANLTDGNADDEVRVRVDTDADGAVLSVADDGDSLTVTDTTNGGDPSLGLGDYEYRVFRPGTGDEPDAVGTLSVGPPDGDRSEFDVGDSAEFGFESNIYRARRGEVAELPVRLDDADAATVSVGGPTVGYEINATLVDGNDDGVVRLLFDTTAAGRTGETLAAAADGDSVTVIPGSEVTRDAYIEIGDYPLSLYRGTETTGSPADVGTLSLQAGNLSGATEAAGSDSPEITPVDTGTGSGNGGAVALGVGGLLAVGGVALLFRTVTS